MHAIPEGLRGAPSQGISSSAMVRRTSCAMCIPMMRAFAPCRFAAACPVKLAASEWRLHATALWGVMWCFAPRDMVASTSSLASPVDHRMRGRLCDGASVQVCAWLRSCGFKDALGKGCNRSGRSGAVCAPPRKFAFRRGVRGCALPRACCQSPRTIRPAIRPPYQAARAYG